VKKCAVVVAFIGVLALALPAAGQLYLEFAGTPIRDIPVDCSEWHELFPTFCLIHHQDDYVDNGDGVVSICDVIVLNGVRYHVDWVGPTYVLENQGTGDRRWYEPTEPLPPTNPVCSFWHMVYPDFCTSHHVDGWDDNGDDVVSECDFIWIDGIAWHVVEVGLDITVTEEPSPAEQTSWGHVKSLFSIF